jgi:hypothetical protein
MGVPMWEQLPQMKDVVPTPPYDGAGDYFGHTGEDALRFGKKWDKRGLNSLNTLAPNMHLE